MGTPPPKRTRAPVLTPSKPSLLSTNWKKFQDTLKPRQGQDSGPQSGGVKVKDEERTVGQEPNGVGKKRKTEKISRDKAEGGGSDKKKKQEKEEGKVRRQSATSASASASPTKKRKMGPPPPAPVTGLESGMSKLARFAEDNDISPEDLARAYGVDITKKPPPKAAPQLLPPSPATGITAKTKATTTITTATTTKTTTTTTVIPPSPAILHPLPFSLHQETPPTTQSAATLGKYLSLDCEMVACGPPPPHERSQLARVSLVNYHGHTILDTFVLPSEPVTDWRTPISGVRPTDMANAIPFDTARQHVQTLLAGRVLVGHALQNDLQVLALKHPRRDIRDTAQLGLLRERYGGGRAPALKRLSVEVLGVEIQGGEHSSVVDARAAMLIYRRFRREFEDECVRLYGRRAPGKGVPRVIVGPGGLGGEGEEGEGSGSESDSGGDEEEGGEADGGDGEGGTTGKKGSGRKPRNRSKKKKRKRKYK